MQAPRKIVTIFGTRPEAIKLFPLLHRLADDPHVISRIIVTGQHRGMLDQVLAIAKVTPDHDLEVMQADQSLDRLSARLLVGLGDVLDRERPEIVVVQGDTSSAMMGALAAYYRQIPVCHVEAGLRSGDTLQPWPEEVNRRTIGSIAAIHCAPTKRAASALLREGARPATVHVTGNTVVDALHWTVAAIAQTPSLVADVSRIERRFAGKQIIVATAHRRENLGTAMENIASALAALAKRPDVAIVFPVHPNPSVRNAIHARLGGHDNIALLEPLDYPNFVRLLALATLVLTDSGGIQEEATALGKPTLVLRNTTERAEAIDGGSAKLVGVDADGIIAQATRLLDDADACRAMAVPSAAFGDGKASERIAHLVKHHQLDRR